MPQHQLLFELLSLITQPQPLLSEINRFVLLVRYHHRSDLPLLIQFITAMLHSDGLFSSHSISYSLIPRIIKLLILQTDFFLTVVIHCKLPSLLRAPISEPFKQWLRAGNKKLPVQATQAINEVAKILEGFENIGFFNFILEMLNVSQRQRDQDVMCYYLQIREMIRQGFILSQQQVSQCQRNTQIECSKMRRRGYVQDLIRHVWSWNQNQLLIMKSQQQGSHQNIYLQTLERVVACRNNLLSTTLLRLLETSLQEVKQIKSGIIISLTDCVFLKGSERAALQCVLFVVPNIFLRVKGGEMKIDMSRAYNHFRLWAQVSKLRRLPNQLISSLLQWLPLIYHQKKLKAKDSGQLMQLYQRELMILEEVDHSKNFSSLVKMVGEIQSRKLQDVYEMMGSLKQQMAQESDKKTFFNAQQIEKSDSLVNSLLDSLCSSKGSPGKGQNNQIEGQLRLFSKNDQWTEKEKEMTSIVDNKHVQIILSLIDLFQYKRQSSIHSQTTPSLTQYLTHRTNFLPVDSSIHTPSQYTYTAYTAIPILPLPIKQPSLKIKQKQQRIVTLDFSPIQENPKKVASSRGTIVKCDRFELSFLVESDSFKTFCLYLTFLKQIEQCSLKLQQRSIKFMSNLHVQLTHPTVGKQFKFELRPSWIKLYKIAGVQDSDRFVKSKIKLEFRNRKQILNENYDLPLYLYNLMHWLPISSDQFEIFNKPARRLSQWHLLKKYDLLNIFLPLHEKDQRGNILAKLLFLEEKVFLRIVLVSGRLRVQLINSKNHLVILGILEVLAKHQQHK